MPYCSHCGKEFSGDVLFCPNCGAPVTSSTTRTPPTSLTPSPLPQDLEREIILADWGDRFVAWLIDVIIVGAVSELLSLPGFTIHPMLSFFRIGSRDVIQFLYWTIMEGSGGKSIGKTLMRLKMTKTDGKPATFVDAAVAGFGKAFLLPIDCIVGWVVESCKEKRQRLFNMISNTIVVKTPKETT